SATRKATWWIRMALRTGVTYVPDRSSAGADYFLLPRAVLLIRLRLGVDPRTTVVAFKTTRRASFTASDVGNASATSGWRATSVVPFKRCAYLPRMPGPNEARSYSGRRSSGLRLPFFIGAA